MPQQIGVDLVDESDLDELEKLNRRALRLALLMIPRNEIVPGEPVGAWDEAFMTLQMLKHADHRVRETLN